MGKRLKFEEKLEEFQNSIFNTEMISDKENKMLNEIPSEIIDLSEAIIPINTNIVTSEIVSPIIMEYASNEIIDNVRIENIEQDSDKEKNVQSNIEQKENKNEVEESIDQLQLLDAIRNLDMETFLKETSTGFIILNHYKKHGQLNTQMRKKLADVVITHLPITITKKPYPLELKNMHIRQLAIKVADYFKEKSEMYYVPPLYEGQHQKISKGIFVDRYRNNRRDCIKSGLLKSKKSNKASETLIDDINVECLKLCEPHVQWLKHNNEPWADVVKHWEASRLARTKDITTLNGNVQLLFTKWPILKNSQGYTLIESDYAAQFGNVLSIYNEWPEFSRKIYTLMQTDIKDRVYEEQLHQINENISEEERNIRLLKLLPALCVPTMRIRMGKRSMKPTITESLNSFILSVNSLADLEHNIERQRNRVIAFNLTLQPFLIFVGRDASSIDAYYVCVDNNLYKIESALKAIDVCYKCFFVLHACYPKECQQIWLLIQKCLYKMSTKNDVINNKVMSIEIALNKM